MMQGDIWISLAPFGLPQRMTLLLQFHHQRFITPPFTELETPSVSEQTDPNLNPTPLFSGLRVLVADDDNMNRKVTKRVLEKLGCEVSAVSSGFECLSAAAPSVNAFRIIFVDLHMPDIDGFEVAKRIRKLHSRNGPVIIALTASAEENIWERCIKAGMNGLIWKPVVLQGIVDELRRVLQ